MTISAEGGQFAIPKFQFRKIRLILIDVMREYRGRGLAVLQAFLADVFE
jgi:hypothetical protein